MLYKIFTEINMVRRRYAACKVCLDSSAMLSSETGGPMSRRLKGL